MKFVYICIIGKQTEYDYVRICIICIQAIWVVVEAYVCVDILNVINKNDFDLLHIIKLEMWIYM